MSERDKLAKIIASHTVSWDHACIIADSIFDEGYGSPEDLRRQQSFGFDEAAEAALEIVQRFRKVQQDLLGTPVSDADLGAARDGIDRSSPISYGRYDSWVSEGTLDAIETSLRDDIVNPFDVNS